MNKNFEDFENGKIKILILIGRLTEGYDNPCISVIGICCNINSQQKFIQIIGRAVRNKFDSKSDTKAKIITHKIFNLTNFIDEFNEENIFTDENIDENIDKNIEK
jgi:superfamily II DNA or RNA helicase